MREMEAINPETGLAEVQQIPKEKLDEIEALVASAIGIDTERSDSLTVSSSTFVLNSKALRSHGMIWIGRLSSCAKV